MKKLMVIEIKRENNNNPKTLSNLCYHGPEAKLGSFCSFCLGRSRGVGWIDEISADHPVPPLVPEFLLYGAAKSTFNHHAMSDS